MGTEKYRFNDPHSFNFEDGTRNQSSNNKCKSILCVGIVFLLVGFAGGFLIAWFTKPTDDNVTTTTTLPNAEISEQEKRRIDCYPESAGGVDIVTEQLCKDRGCVWTPSSHDGVPWCHVPQPENSTPFGYKVIRGPEETAIGQRWYLERTSPFAIYGENIRYVTFEVEHRGDNVLRFKFDDTNDDTRYKVPVPITLNPDKATNPLYRLEVNTTDTFSFKIIRKSTEAVLWDTSVGGFAFSNQFLQIATMLPSTNVYGFGENLHWTLKHNMNYQTWPMFARDQGVWSGDKSLHQNFYSVHPYYECLEEDGNAHGVLLLNSNAMDYTMSPLPMLTYRTIGGILDFYMFLGPTPENVVQQYTGVIGRPYMPPYWMLGFQLCRYGYQNTSMLKDSVDRMLQYDIPYDIQYVDIDHMYKQRDFTLDEQKFGDLPTYFHEIRKMGLKTIIILDPAIEINETYAPYTEGRDLDIYIQWPDRQTMPAADYEEYKRMDMMGYVWPEWKVVFPDFFLNETAEWWTKWVVNFTDTLPFDALWVDMNEPANFGTNENRPWNWPKDDPTEWSLKCPESMWDDPPYRTKAAYEYDHAESGRKERISAKTICMVGTQERGANRQYDTHNLYGWKQSQVSLQSVRAAVKKQSGGKDLRSMIVSRSTYPGSAAHAGRWLGDNSSSWKDLWLSIIGLLEFNIMGLPYIGADICGFFGDSTPEMCKRWQELGAFYPFARNHNHENAKPQDPGYFGPYVAVPARDALLIRYKLLPYLYTLFHRANTVGGTVVRPMFHEYSKDSNTWDLDQQFLWGPALMIVPILEEKASELKFYIPAGRWYDWYTFGVSYDSSGSFNSIPVSDSTPIQLHIRGGYILPWQQPANNTHYSRNNAFGLIVALDSDDGKASGELFWDDGDSIDTYQSGNCYFATFEASMNKLIFSIEHNGIIDEMSELIIDTVEILGVTSTTGVKINNTVHNPNDVMYNGNIKVLNITNLQAPMNNNFEISWSTSST